ncbi:proline-rich protein 2-like [Equus quagga]|uniref:proline-rich protein 2-like n=1 Tax=Equus quagga TaxID=89248 RepID=UPI001EE1B507|nr:proline-rich protein 2-like [Equus quagga]
MSPKSTIFPSGFLIFPLDAPLLLPAPVRSVCPRPNRSNRPPPPRPLGPGTRGDPDSRGPGTRGDPDSQGPELAETRRDPPVRTPRRVKEEARVPAGAGAGHPARRPPRVSCPRRSAPGPRRPRPRPGPPPARPPALPPPPGPPERLPRPGPPRSPAGSALAPEPELLSRSGREDAGPGGAPRQGQLEARRKVAGGGSACPRPLPPPGPGVGGPDRRLAARSAARARGRW